MPAARSSGRSPSRTRAARARAQVQSDAQDPAPQSPSTWREQLLSAVTFGYISPSAPSTHPPQPAAPASAGARVPQTMPARSVGVQRGNDFNAQGASSDNDPSPEAEAASGPVAAAAGGASSPSLIDAIKARKGARARAEGFRRARAWCACAL